MTRPRPRLSQLALWDQHVQMVLAIVREALMRLAARPVTGGEPVLNRALYECALEANRARHDSGQPHLEPLITWEGRNQPSPATAGASPENKIPDFQCGYIDHLCPDPLLSARIFVIECKRLGHPSPSGWNFNVRYVKDGVARFVDDRWKYGKHTEAGAMVGYLDGTPVLDVLTEVNVAAAAQSVPALGMPTGPSAPLHELVHSLVRNFPESPFQLAHLWIENPQPAPPTRRTAASAKKTAAKKATRRP